MSIDVQEHVQLCLCLQAIGQFEAGMLYASLRSWRNALPTSNADCGVFIPRPLVPLGQGLDRQEKTNRFQIVISTSQQNSTLAEHHHMDCKITFTQQSFLPTQNPIPLAARS
jgi:hypothetical protein